MVADVLEKYVSYPATGGTSLISNVSFLKGYMF